ncbi:MAG: hypothetical protein M0Q95_18110 [Porticoccaceae bacterium]|nr:hypothetical protein [Porticoccaceae bacterium]
MKKTPKETIITIRRAIKRRTDLERQVALLANPALAEKNGVSLRTVQRIERGELA